MGATTPRFAKVRGPRGDVRVNSEKRWLKGTPKTKMPAGEAGTDRKLLVMFQLATARQRRALWGLEKLFITFFFARPEVLANVFAAHLRLVGMFGIFFNIG